MHDMSNTRKEIAARLGFAAGNGAKAKMDRRDGNYFVIRGFADDEIVGEKSLDTKQEGDYYGQKMLEYIKKSNPKAKKVIVNIYEVVNNGENKVVKTLSFRVGEKSSFGRAEKVLSDGSVSLDFTEANEWLSTVSDEALKYIISDSNAAAKAMGSGGKKFNYYTDLALTAAQMLRSTKRGGHRLNSSRPGTKTRMTREQTEEQKAGLKIMSAADPAVGEKIATLIKEGKPQDQAVAIALDMKRRGEL